MPLSKFLFSGLILSMCACAGSGVAQTADDVDRHVSEESRAAAQKIVVHGHRGARGRRPENTLAAFKYALELGVPVLELDMAITKDRNIVVSHDPHINPDICLDKAGQPVRGAILIKNLTLKAVQEFDCGTLKNSKFPNQVPVPGERIPTLRQVFQLVLENQQYKDVQFNIETKIDPNHPDDTVGPLEFTRRVVHELRKFKVMDRTILQSFDPRTLEWARRLAPSLRRSLLVDDPGIDLLAAAQKVKAHYISPYYLFLQSKEIVEAFHAAGIQVAPWTVNTPKDWQKMVNVGVDAIITDDPKALMDFLNK